MEAKGLTIGDWVLYPYQENEKRPGRITYISENGSVGIAFDNGMEVATNLRYCEPIPLTPEILEKNGFYWGHTATEEDFCGAVGCGYPDKGWCFDEGAGEIKIIFPNETDGGLIRLDDQSADKHLEVIFGKPIMVHELQHALRLCRIDKEIVI